MDILSIHPYRYPPMPEETDFIGVIKRADALVRKYGAPKEIWITEIGWPTNIGGNGSSEAKQAAMIARTYMQAMASGVVQKTFWYDFRNDGLDPNYNEHNFGIIRQDQSVKPACIAFRTMTQRLEGKKFVKALDVPPGVCTYVFESKTARTLAAWCVTGTATLAISGTFPSITVTNLIGQQSVAKLVNGRASVRISENPVFIDGIPANSKVAAQSMKPARRVASEESPVRISASSLGASRFAVEIIPLGLLKTAAQVTVRVPGYVDTFKLPAGKAAHREEYAIPEGLSLDPTKGVL
ncbi:MAG: glycosyl hydrolase, partial [Armatimonadetes bacterium]|nr:glycosyl hydrolase [Armatimonadota bacterium]